MANAKTYNELNQASAVNASDLVAVAQSDNTELQKTTVSDLANAVGELNQAGALAELSLATSIGKNLLAQRLNEKGVENITPNNTLIEMADAMRDLSVEGGNENILATYQKSIDSSISVSGNPRIFKHPITQDMIITMNTNVYYVPYSENYTSWDDIVAGATHTFDVTTLNPVYVVNQGGYASYCVSEDFSKLMITVDTANKFHVILNVSKDAGFSVLHEFQKDFYTSNDACAIDNSGNFIVAESTTRITKGATAYDLVHDTMATFTLPFDNNADHPIDLFIKNSNIYGFFSNQGGTSRDNYGRISYAIAKDGTISFSGVKTAAGTYDSGWAVYRNSNMWLYDPSTDDEPVFLNCNNNNRVYSSGNNYHAYWDFAGMYRAYFPSTLNSLSPVRVGAYSVLLGNFDSSLFNASLKLAHITKNGSVYTLTIPGLPTMHIDAEAASYSIDNNNGCLVPYVYTGYSSNKHAMGIYSSLTSGIVLTSNAVTYTGYVSNVSKIQTSLSSEPMKLLAKRRTVGDSTVYYDPTITPADILKPGYDVNTQSVPLPADN